MKKLYLLVLLSVVFGYSAYASHSLPMLNVVWTVNPDGSITVSGSTDPNTNGGSNAYQLMVEITCNFSGAPVNWATAPKQTFLGPTMPAPGSVSTPMPPLTFNVPCPGVTYTMRVAQIVQNVALIQWSTPEFTYSAPGTAPPFTVDSVSASQDTLCPGQTSQLNSSAVGACLPATAKFQWIPATGLTSATLKNPVASPTVTTTYVVIATDECTGQTATDSVRIVVLPPPLTGLALSQTACAGESVTFTLTGSNGITFQWFSSTNGNTFTPIAGATGTSYTINPVTTTTQFYVHVIGDSTTCPANSPKFTLTVIPAPPLAVSPVNPEVCQGDTVMLTASGGDTYTWSPPINIESITIPNPKVWPTTTMYYYVETTNAYGCTKKDSVQVIVNQKPVLYASSQPTICPLSNGIITVDSTFGGTPNYSYSLNYGTFQTSGTFTDLWSDTYSVRVRDSKGCINETTVNLIEVIDIVAGFTASPIQGFIPFDVNFVNTSSGSIFSYHWDFGDGTSSDVESPTHTFGEHGDYIVTLSAIGADIRCMDTAVVMIRAIGKSDLIRPNVFTPNGDGINDVFTLGSANIVELELLIFDRWGRKVATITDPAKGWDGTRNGGPECSSGTYFYTFTAKGIDNFKHKGSGSIELLR